MTTFASVSHVTMDQPVTCCVQIIVQSVITKLVIVVLMDGGESTVKRKDVLDIRKTVRDMVSV